jgi:hypothetical protein
LIAAPLYVGDGYAPEPAPLDRVDHITMAKSADEALALQSGLLRVHAARDVGRQHQFQVDFTLRCHSIAGKPKAGAEGDDVPTEKEISSPTSAPSGPKQS